MRTLQLALTLALTSCLLMGCDTEDQRQGMIAANVRAIQEARKTQAEIATTRKCPDALAGWQRSRDGLWLETTAGTAKAQYQLRFECQPDLEFSLAVRYSFDSGTYVGGRDTGPLEITYGHFTAPRTIKIAPTDDAAVVATRVVDEPADS